MSCTEEGDRGERKREDMDGVWAYSSDLRTELIASRIVLSPDLKTCCSQCLVKTSTWLHFMPVATLSSLSQPRLAGKSGRSAIVGNREAK